MSHLLQRTKVVLAICAVLCLAPTCPGDEPAQEYTLKAAFVYNFARFIDWPGSVFTGDGAPFVIAVVGKDPFDGALEKSVSGKKIGNRSIEIKHFDSVDKIGVCQILFVPMTDDESESRVIQKVDKQSVLTIGESDKFCDNGGCVRFFTEENKIRFEINSQATDKAKLQISSKLLKLAKIVKK